MMVDTPNISQTWVILRFYAESSFGRLTFFPTFSLMKFIFFATFRQMSFWPNVRPVQAYFDINLNVSLVIWRQSIQLFKPDIDKVLSTMIENHIFLKGSSYSHSGGFRGPFKTFFLQVTFSTYRTRSMFLSKFLLMYGQHCFVSATVLNLFQDQRMFLFFRFLLNIAATRHLYKILHGYVSP